MTRTRNAGTGAPVDAVRDMYAHYGDRAGFDRHLHPEITIWESDRPGMIGLAELDRLRDERADAGQPGATLAVEEALCDQWGESAAVVRYLLRAGRSGRPDETFRVTDVLTADPSGWRIVHHHAELVADAGSANAG